MASNNLTLTTKFADEYKLTETLKQLQTRSKVNKTLDLIRLVTMGDRTAVSATCDCIYLFSKSTLLELVVDSFRKTAENEGIDGATRKIASIVLRSADRKNKYERRNFKIEVNIQCHISSCYHYSIRNCHYRVYVFYSLFSFYFRDYK